MYDRCSFCFPALYSELRSGWGRVQGGTCERISPRGETRSRGVRVNHCGDRQVGVSCDVGWTSDVCCDAYFDVPLTLLLAMLLLNVKHPRVATNPLVVVATTAVWCLSFLYI